MEPKYREDIDGLRALAVLAVIFNHAGISLFSGGFIGVDVFFVISGYLITGIIARGVDANQFSLIGFYERRIRRIFPALFAIIAFTVIICIMIYDPEKFRVFGKSVVATTFFVSNINFWQESGYFDISAQLKPLLHTWSLAVEEQFYIFFPLLMMLLLRFYRKGTALILSVLAIISLVLSTSMVAKDPVAAFYLPHSRAWELLAGSILAFNIHNLSLKKSAAKVLEIAGGLMILIPIFLYSSDTSFPGLASMPPVLGAALIILCGNREGSLFGNLMRLPLMVFIGKISYSLYLWHWPLLIFGKYYAIRPLTGLEITLELVLIFIMSTLSWRYIETPFRSGRPAGKKQLFLLAGTAMICASIAGATIYSKEGFPGRDGSDLRADEDKKNDRWDFKECNVNSGDNTSTIPVCYLGADAQKPTFLLWGDSHAPTLGKAINISSTAANISGNLTYSAACPPLLDLVTHPTVGDIHCIDYNRMVFHYLDEHPEITTVILVSRWTLWVEGSLYKEEEGNNVFLKDGLDGNNASSEEELFTLGMDRTIRQLLASNRKIFIVAPIPEIGYDVPSSNFIALRTGRDLNEIIAPTASDYIARNQKTINILEGFSEKYSIELIEPWKVLCSEVRCRVTLNDIPLYNDDDHLSAFASEMIASVFDTIFNTSKKLE